MKQRLTKQLKPGKQPATNGVSQNLQPGHYYLADLNRAITECVYLKQVRMPKTRVQGPHVMMATSHKAREHAPKLSRYFLEGRPEGYAPLSFEFDSTIEYYLPQPFTLHFLHGCLRRYTPDFVIFYTNGKAALCEVKPASKFSVPETQERHDFIAAACAAEDVGFIRLSAETIYRQPRFDTQLMLYPYVNTASPRVLQELIRLVHVAQRPITLRTLQQTCPEIGAAEIAQGLFEGQLAASYQLPWGPWFSVEQGV